MGGFLSNPWEASQRSLLLFQNQQRQKRMDDADLSSQRLIDQQRTMQNQQMQQGINDQNDLRGSLMSLEPGKNPIRASYEFYSQRDPQRAEQIRKSVFDEADQMLKTDPQTAVRHINDSLGLNLKYMGRKGKLHFMQLPNGQQLAVDDETGQRVSSYGDPKTEPAKERFDSGKMTPTERAEYLKGAGELAKAGTRPTNMDDYIANKSAEYEELTGKKATPGLLARFQEKFASLSAQGQVQPVATVDKEGRPVTYFPTKEEAKGKSYPSQKVVEKGEDALTRYKQNLRKIDEDFDKRKRELKTLPGSGRERPYKLIEKQDLQLEADRAAKKVQAQKDYDDEIKSFGGTPGQTSQLMNAMPPAGQNRGKIVESTSGKRWRSNGTTWVPM